MKKIINVIALVTDSNLGRLFLSDMRVYFWGGFAVHNVKDRYIYYFGDPEIDDDGWFVVRSSLLPLVQALVSRFGVYNDIDWEKA